MDDRNAYILNSLWSRHYDLGRVIRFRHVTRGRQAQAFEILTAEQNEFTVYLFGPAFDAGKLAQIARASTILANQHFPVALMVAARDGSWSVDGPQGARLMVGQNPHGQYLLPDEWTTQDMSQLGLRLAWLHRVLIENMDRPRQPVPPAIGVELALARASATEPMAAVLARLSEVHMARLELALRDGDPAGWVHGDVQPAAILLDHDRQILGVVDWALLHVGEPMEDLVDVFVHWCVGNDGQVDGERGRILLEAYRSLRRGAAPPWLHVVNMWSARRIIDAAAGRRPLPRGFATYLADPGALVKPLQFCDARTG